MKKKKPDQPKDVLDQFEAYGEYSYAYRHAADQKRKHHQMDEPDHRPMEEAKAPAEEIPEEELEETRSPEEQARLRSRAITSRVIVLLAIVVGVIIVLQSTVFRLTRVYVYGNVNKSAQEIAAASGLVKGLNIFAITEDEVKRNLSKDHTIIFKGIQKDYPNTIYLYIAEREAVAATQWLGLLYTLDASGMVMDETNTTDKPADMPTVMGLIVTNIHVGQMLEVRDPEQLNAYYDIMSELGLQYYTDQVREINLTDPEDIYLLIANGISVRLGDRTVMRAKIGALRTDIAYLQQLGKTAGVLDVTTPEDAKYSPES